MFSIMRAVLVVSVFVTAEANHSWGVIPLSSISLKPSLHDSARGAWYSIDSIIEKSSLKNSFHKINKSNVVFGVRGGSVDDSEYDDSDTEDGYDSDEYDSDEYDSDEYDSEDSSSSLHYRSAAMGGIVGRLPGPTLERYLILPLLQGILVLYDISPVSNWMTYRFVLTGLIKLVVHRTVLDKQNLYKAPVMPIPEGRKIPSEPLRGRGGDGFGTDIQNPTTGMTGAPIGRNMPALPKHLRDPHGKPDVQMVAQRLLARESFKPAADQLNVLAASWIQAMVHDWIGHFDGTDTVTLDKGEESGCPFSKSFRFKNTKVRKDGNFESERTQWWDASFVYGNDEKAVDEARTYKGGKMKTDPKGTPHVLPERADGSYSSGDNKNSWVGMTVLQELFIKEHNFVAEMVAKENPDMTDKELFDASRLVIAALVAKIHTIDWTCELLKTDLLDIGMKTNWFGILRAVLGFFFGSSFYKCKLIPTLLSKVGQDKANNEGTPFCLTEEFAAVYRLHSLSPPGLVVGKKHDDFIPLIDLCGDKGREAFKKTPERPAEIMKSLLSYPCGGLYSSNYPDAFRKVAPTDDDGKDLPESEHIDLAALDLFRDRERGILRFNDFRRALNLKPYRSWMELTGGNKADSRKLGLIYGPGQAGIERLDLLVGDMYEKKPEAAFALSETSFVIFLAMASRRLDADPYLNQYYTEKFYTEAGLKHVEKTSGLFDLVDRHYPELAVDFKDAKGKQKQSVFKPTKGPTDWENAIANKVVPKELTDQWTKTKDANAKFFDELEEESQDYQKKLKSTGKPAVPSQVIYILISVLLFVIPYYVHQNFADSLEHIGVRELWPVTADVQRELAYSNCRHTDLILRIYHLFTNPFIFISQVYLMDKTPTLFTLYKDDKKTKDKKPWLRFNIGFVYFVFLVVYGLLSDFYLNSFVAITLYFFYNFAVLGSFEDWLVRVVGEDSRVRTAFFVYCFCQGSQIVIHCIFENYYDWNLYHLFIIQQHITIWNIIDLIGVYPSFSEGVAYWIPIFEKCIEGENNPIMCGL